MKKFLTVFSSAAMATLSLTLLAAEPPGKGIIAIRDEANAIPLSHAIDRLRAYSSMPMDVVNVLENPPIDYNSYTFMVEMGVSGNDPELGKAWGGTVPESDDAWALKTVSKTPLVIAVTGKRPRGVLYAAYRLADLLKLGRDLSNLDEVHSPLVPMREAAVCATAFGGPGSRHSEYLETLNELPRYGINGVMVVPGQWRVALGPGRVNPPITIEKNGDVQIDESTHQEWLTFMGIIKSYDMNIMLTIEPFIPPTYTQKQVDNFYKTGKVPAKYFQDLRTFYTKLVNQLFDALPYVDTICLTPGVEGAQYGGGNAQAPRLFLQGQNVKTCVSVMKVYLDVVTRIASQRRKSVMLWTHQWGSTTDDQIAMWDLPESYPGVIPMGEDYWPNELWPNGGTHLPIMAYLPSDARSKYESHAFGILSIDDAEYYGGGSMPNAFADPYIFTAEELVKHKAQWVGFRLNQHDRTPFGTLWTVPEILILQECNGLWTGSRPPKDVWDEWLERRYGKAAAPLVSKALASSGSIMIDGFSVDGMNFFEHSCISAGRLAPGGLIYRLFGPPGKALFPKNKISNETTFYGETLFSNSSRSWLSSPEQIPAQLQLQTISIEDFRQDQAAAMQAANQAVAWLDEAAPQLSRADYDCLHGIFINAQAALRIFSALGEMAYAANLMENNYAGVDNPRKLFEKAASGVKALANDPSIRVLDYANSSTHDVRNDLLQILDEYRSHALGQIHN